MARRKGGPDPGADDGPHDAATCPLCQAVWSSLDDLQGTVVREGGPGAAAHMAMVMLSWVVAQFLEHDPNPPTLAMDAIGQALRGHGIRTVATPATEAELDAAALQVAPTTGSVS